MTLSYGEQREKATNYDDKQPAATKKPRSCEPITSDFKMSFDLAGKPRIYSSILLISVDIANLD